MCIEMDALLLPLASIGMSMINIITRQTSTQDPDAMSEVLDTCDRCADEMFVLMQNAKRVNKYLPSGHKIPVRKLSKIYNHLQRFPRTANEWTQLHLKTRQTQSATGTCTICMEDNVQLASSACACKVPHTCTKCLLLHWYHSTDGLTTDHSKCPVCRTRLSWVGLLHR